MTVALVPYVCCPLPATSETFLEPAMFFRGGYGETRSMTLTVCRCGVVLATTFSSLRPRQV